MNEDYISQAISAENGGFTLFELLVVLAIISVSILIAAPSFHSLGREASLDKLAADTARLAVLKRMESINSGKPVAMTVDVRSRTIAPEDRVHRILIPNATAVELLTGIELKYTEERGSILFYPDGASSGGQISFSQPSGAHVVVRILWATGLPTVRRQDGADG